MEALKPTLESLRMEELREAIREASVLIASASRVVAFTGAGISVESGIPDFRSSGGLWSQYDPDVYCNIAIFKERPDLFWKMAVNMQSLIQDARPNPAHLALAELESMGMLTCVVTQNVDSLHQEAGSKIVHELHGNASRSLCTLCGLRLPVAHSLAVLESGKTVPQCPKCSGVMKMDVVLFGEPLPSTVMGSALDAAMQADILLVVGTSLTVSPANSLVALCRSNRGKIVICDPVAPSNISPDVILLGKAGEVLPELVKACKAKKAA